MAYRTQEQYDTMMENCINGNWSDAGQNGADGGFYAKDLVEMYNGELDDPMDLVYLMECICENRLQAKIDAI